MPRIKPVAENEITGEVREIFKEIEGEFGMVPSLFSTYAHHPAVLRANWNKVKAVLLTGLLSRKTKETIAMLVSKENACDYCYKSHSFMLMNCGISRDDIAVLEEDLEKSDFSEKEKALIEFARMANSDPLRIPDEALDRARLAGATEAEIIEALATMEIFTSFNKFLDSLEITLPEGFPGE